MSLLIALIASAALSQVPGPPATFPLEDSCYGKVTLAYDGVNAWRGVNVASLPSNPCCSGPVSFALHYTLTRDPSSSSWWLVTQYRTENFTTYCPVASTATDPPSCSYWTRIDMSLSSPMVTFAVNGTAPGTQAWPAYRGVTLRLDLP